ncbi:MAG: 4-hydroxythreonine-4-phosphate dehydrogenase PdxA [Candidatus Ornithospirochaeta sp.]
MKKEVYLAIPQGDPAGIGPEIVLKSLRRKWDAKIIVVGSKKVFEETERLCGIPKSIYNSISDPREAVDAGNTVNIIDLDNIDMSEYKVGTVSAMCGKAAYEYIEKSIELANKGLVDCVVTPPINKEALHAANVPFIGHTEIFGKLTDTEDPLTMFEVNGLRIFFLTRHVSLRKACDMIGEERIVDYVVRCNKALNQIGVGTGTMAIAGLNPHCGEHGLFGNEEESIYKAVDTLKGMGIDVAGPIGADSVFHLAKIGKFNSVLSLYHDQGHIAAKTLDFEHTISLTLGMPILRTSVDHGTAMDIAGRGVASEVSMEEAIRLGIKYAPGFKREVK